MIGGGTFAYEAARADGTIVTGLVTADAEDTARRSIANSGLLPMRVQPVREGRERRAIGAADLGLGLRVLADLIEAGVPMNRALSTLEELAPASWRVALPHLRQAVKEGSSLADALESSPIAIPPLVVGIAQAGEAGQGLAHALRSAATLMESTAASRAAVKAALAYPLVLAGAGVASIGMLVGVVLPRFAQILADLNQALPPATRLVLGASLLARQAFVPAATVALVAMAIWRAWTRTPGGRVRWHALLATLPILGDIRRGRVAARAAHTLSALLASAVPIGDAMRFAARATGDAEFERRLLAARQRLLTGERLSAALAQCDACTATVVRLTRAGEVSGRVAAMLAHGAKLEQERADRALATAVRVLEPALIFAFAAIVAVVAAALLQAVYSVRPAA